MSRSTTSWWPRTAPTSTPRSTPRLSQQILDDAGIDTATPIQVRLLTDSENPRRQSEYELIRESVAQAGFDLVNASRPDWGEQLANTSIYDAALFGWQSTAHRRRPSDVPQYVSDGSNNFYGYNNPEVDALGDGARTRRPMRRARTRS